MEKEHILELEGIYKSYQRKIVLKNINISLETGKIYGFIGKNGAGKTTTMKIIVGLTKPSQGNVYIMGKHNPKDLEYLRRNIGCIIENPALYQEMSASENLKALCLLYGIKDKGRVKNILKLVGCYSIFEFSSDLKQRCINYELLSGNSRTKVFLSHYMYIFILLGSMMISSLSVGMCKYGVTDWITAIWENKDYILKIIVFIYMIAFSIVSVCMIFAIVSKDTARSTILTFVFLFLAYYIMAAIAAVNLGDSMTSVYETPPMALLFYPPYLWRWILNPELQMIQLVGAGIVTVIWCGASFVIGNYCFCKTELK